ncbi:hypothetical protein [Mycoplasma yeatsii]|uniref:Transmembrane protein n=1 Tax=Mycoplasma yeatsii TaxID=51365 RepID=A0ABU0NDZ1_9MOLU|nr:hypothetical protein [Mycoplasma yeatsii]MDQ0567638.1 hypothetical protein [Mycoplasma yeatsii]
MIKNKYISNLKLKLINNKFSMRIKDSNPEIQKRNASIYFRSILAIVVFLLTIMPFYVYVYIIFNDQGLLYYFDHFKTISSHLIELPSKAYIWGYGIAGIIFTFIVLVLFVLFKGIVSVSDNKRYKQVVIVSIVFLSVITILFQTLSQYYYGFYEDFLHYETITGNSNNKIDAMKKIAKWYYDHYSPLSTSSDKLKAFYWISDEKIWWVSFVQFFFMFTISISLQNVVFADNSLNQEDKYVTHFAQKNSLFSGSKFKIYANKIFSYKAKTLSNWVLVTVFVISSSVIFYIVIISTRGPIQSLFKWTYEYPNLLKDMNGFEDSVFNKFKNTLSLEQTSPLTILSFPILVLGITLSTSLFLVSVSIRGQNFSSLSFRSQYIVLLIESILLIISVFVSQLELQRISVAWNTDSMGMNYLNSTKDTISENIYDQLVNEYPLNGIDEKIKTIFTNNYVIFSEFTILITSTLVSFAIIGKGIYTKKNIIKEVEQEIENKKFKFLRGYTHAKKSWRK